MHTLPARIGPLRNHLLAALPGPVFAQLSGALEPVTLRLGDRLFEPGMQLHHACFPTSAVVSLVYVTATGASAELAGVGPEGMVGIALFMGGNTTSSSAVVQTAGQGWRLERHLLARLFAEGGPLQQVLLRYTQALATEIAQTAACYRHHTVLQQLARWLLTTCDRLPGQELVITQELVAHLLGVRRESVTQAAGQLQALGCIRSRRGHIAVLDVARLRACACECYGVVSAELRRLLPATEPA